MRSMETDPRSRNVASETTRAGGYKITHFLSDDSVPSVNHYFSLLPLNPSSGLGPLLVAHVRG